MTNDTWKNKAVRKQCQDAWNETDDEEKCQLEQLWAKDAFYAFWYAKYIIKKPFPPGEAVIAQSPNYAYWYAEKVIKGPWPPGESAIATSAAHSYAYAKDVIKGRWSLGEAVIAKDTKFNVLYKEFLKNSF